jgi:hypothetical protein
MTAATVRELAGWLTDWLLLPVRPSAGHLHHQRKGVQGGAVFTVAQRCRGCERRWRRGLGAGQTKGWAGGGGTGGEERRGTAACGRIRNARSGVRKGKSGCRNSNDAGVRGTRERRSGGCWGWSFARELSTPRRGAQPTAMMKRKLDRDTAPRATRPRRGGARPQGVDLSCHEGSGCCGSGSACCLRPRPALNLVFSRPVLPPPHPYIAPLVPPSLIPCFPSRRLSWRGWLRTTPSRSRWVVADRRSEVELHADAHRCRTCPLLIGEHVSVTPRRRIGLGTLYDSAALSVTPAVNAVLLPRIDATAPSRSALPCGPPTFKVNHCPRPG